MATFEDLQRTDRDSRGETAALVVRLPVDRQLDPGILDGRGGIVAMRGLLLGKEEAEDNRVFGRVRDLPVHVLHSHGGDLHLSRNINPLFPGDPLFETAVEEAEILEILKAAEFDAIVERSRALLSSPPGSAFRAPSGHHVQHFLRVGNIQCDRDAIDAVFFWLLPHLKRVAAILTDTWSISSIAFNIAGLASNYFGGAPRRVEMLPGYHDGSEAATARASDIIVRLARDCADDVDHDEMLVLISATQSGSLAENLNASFSALSLKLSPRYVAIFALGPTEVASLRNLSEDGHYVFRPKNDAFVTRPVQIDPQVYFPLQFQDIPFALNKPEAERHREFFDRYADTGLIKVHRDDDRDPAQGRHHAIHLDVAKIVDHEAFKAKLDPIVARLPKPAILVAPPHAAAQALAGAVRSRLEQRGATPGMTLIHPNLFFSNPMTEDEEEARRFIKAAGPDDEILIVDDVCVTAAAISQFQKYLRTEGYSGRITYLVGIQRMPDPASWTGFARRLRNRKNGLPQHQVVAIEEIALPDLRKHDCPWCQEVMLLNRWAADAPLPHQLQDRRDLLTKAKDTGIFSGIFLTPPGTGRLRLGPDSFYIKQQSTDADAYAAASAAIQSLRVEGRGDRPCLGNRRFPVATVLKWEDYLTEKWTDSILRASILRAGTRDELTFTDEDSEAQRSDALRDLVGSGTAGEYDVALEILLAAGHGKARIRDLIDILGLLAARTDEEVARYMIERLIHDEKARAAS